MKQKIHAYEIVLYTACSFIVLFGGFMIFKILSALFAQLKYSL